MADSSITLNAGSGGAALATDLIASEHYQIIKLTFGALDSQTIASSGSGTVDAGTQRVTIATDDTVTVDNAGTFAVQVDGDALTALQTIDNSIFADDAAFTLASSSVNMAGAIRDDALSSLTAIEGDAVPLRVGSTGALWTFDTLNNAELVAQTTAIQILDNIVHVDDAPFTLGSSSGVMMMGFAGTQSVNANDAAALRCDTDGALHISDGGNSLTVDSTVLDGMYTEDQQQTNYLAILDNISYNNGDAWSAVSADHALTGGVYQTTPQTVSNNTSAPFQITQNGYLITSVNGTVTVDGSGVTQPVSGTVTANLSATTSGGTTLYKNIDVDESEDQVKATAGQVYWIHAMNLSASPLFLKLYNATAANVTVGTTVPDMTFPLATQGDTNGAGFTLSIPNGIAFSTAITIACTTGVADNDSGAPGGNACVVNLGYA